MEHKDTHNNTVSLKDGVTMSLSVHVGDNMCPKMWAVQFATSGSTS